MKCKKGQGLSIQTIIGLIIFIIVLFVIIAIFSSQSNTVFDAVKQLLGLASEAAPTNLTDVMNNG
ncbi:hypothetical protein K8R33_03735 [archaeon]|nr:hypothetical protein [archaeon]